MVETRFGGCQVLRRSLPVRKRTTRTVDRGDSSHGAEIAPCRRRSPTPDTHGYETTLVQSGYSDQSRTARPTGRDRRGNAERDRGIRLHRRLALATPADAGPYDGSMPGSPLPPPP